MARNLKIIANNKLTFKEGFEGFLDSCKARNLRPATIKYYEDLINLLLGLLMKKCL